MRKDVSNSWYLYSNNLTVLIILTSSLDAHENKIQSNTKPIPREGTGLIVVSKIADL